LARSAGVVVVNSTTGLSALHHGRPVTVLGSAIFDMAGLTFQGPLDDFWQRSTAPDAELFKAFRKVVVAQAQLNGSFFTEAGIAQGIEAAMERISVASVLPQAAPVPRTKISPAPLAPAIIRN
jgi:capsular polysaccharide export protein